MPRTSVQILKHGGVPGERSDAGSPWFMSLLRTSYSKVKIELQEHGVRVVATEDMNSPETFEMNPPAMTVTVTAGERKNAGPLAIRFLGGAHGPGSVMLEFGLSLAETLKWQSEAKTDGSQSEVMQRILEASIPAV